MTAMVAIAQATVRNTLGLRRAVGFGLLAVFPAVVFLITARSSSDFARLENYSGWSMFVFLAVVVPIISVVMAGSVLGSERRGETMSFLMLRPLSRYSIAAAKLLSAIAVSFVICGFGALILGIAGSTMLDDFGYLSALLMATLAANAAYSAVFLPVGYLTERATLAGFIYVFVWETAIAGILSGLSGTSLWRIANSAHVALAPDLDLTVTDAAMGNLTPGAGGAAAKIAVLGAISIALTGWLLRTRDLT